MKKLIFCFALVLIFSMVPNQSSIQLHYIQFFIRNIEWNKSNDKFCICVLDPFVLKDFQYVEGKRIGLFYVLVNQVRDSVKDCDILYVIESDNIKLSQHSLDNTLLITTNNSFKNDAGIYLYWNSNNQLRFHINNYYFKKHNLQYSMAMHKFANIK